MAFINQSEFKVMKMPIGRRAPRCDKDQFRAKMTVSTSEVYLQQLAVGGLATQSRRKYRIREKRIRTVKDKFVNGDYTLSQYVNSVRCWVRF